MITARLKPGGKTVRIATISAIVLATSTVVGCGQPAHETKGGAEANESANSTASKPAEPERADAWHDVTIPEGTTLALVLDTPVASDSSRVEDPVSAHLARAIVVDGMEALPAGTTVSGVVAEATRGGKVKGRAQLALRFDEIAPQGSDDRIAISAPSLRRMAPSEKKKDAAKIGIPAAGGAIVGGIVGGKKGAVIGGAVGGGAGTAVVLTDRGQDVRLGKGAPLTLRLTEPIVVRVKATPASASS
jgi:hypothetical protein